MTAVVGAAEARQILIKQRVKILRMEGIGLLTGTFASCASNLANGTIFSVDSVHRVFLGSVN